MALFKSTHIALIFYLNILIFCIQDNPALSDFPLHGQENSSLPKQILNDETGKKVPEYEIVRLRILSKRSADDENVMRVHLSAFGRDIHLRLKKDDDFSERSRNVKFFEARLTDTIQLAEVICEDDDPGTPYIDLGQMAAVTIRHGLDGQLQMDGVIGDDLFIKPASTDANFLPDSFVYDRDFSDESGDSLNSSGSDTRKFFGYSSSEAIKSGVHIVYRTAMKTKSAFKVVLDDVLYNNSNHNRSRHKRPLHVWPEVLLLVDYDSYAMHLSYGFNDTQIKRYYISFFNGVDLRFKTLSDPKISLILTRILVFKNRDDTPYLKRHRYPKLDVFDGSRAIDDLAHVMYLLKTMLWDIHLEFDLAVLLTKLDMCVTEISLCNRATVGLAFLDGACFISHEKKLWYGVAIVEDNGGFDGILTATHEIGHLLGSAHDGENHSRGFQYASLCSTKDGFIMSNKLSSNQIFRWSECSIRLFRKFLSSKNASSCLFNKPSYPNKLEGSELPGAVLSLDEQCKRIWGTQASAWDSRVCTTLHCHEPEDRAFHISRLHLFLPPAAEGSSCGEELHCRHGKCVSKYLAYSQAWNMAPVDNIYSPIIATSKKPPFVEEDDMDCSDDTAELFCDSYFSTIGHKEACRNSRIIEECCHSHKIFCKDLPM